jgi:hypothetical protein
MSMTKKAVLFASALVILADGAAGRNFKAEVYDLLRPLPDGVGQATAVDAREVANLRGVRTVLVSFMLIDTCPVGQPRDCSPFAGYEDYFAQVVKEAVEPVGLTVVESQASARPPEGKPALLSFHLGGDLSSIYVARSDIREGGQAPTYFLAFRTANHPLVHEAQLRLGLRELLKDLKIANP